MIRRVYQFADVPLTIGNQYVNFPQDTQWMGEIGSYTHSYKRYATSHRFVHQPTVISFEGDLIYDGSFLPSHIEQKLRSYIGITDTLIIYALPNDYPHQFDLCQPCDSCIDCQVIWLSAPSVLTSVNVSGDVDNGFKINLSFTLMDYFYPLNKLVWKYNGNYAQDYDVRELPPTVDEIKEEINCYPTCADLFTDCVSCRFFSRLNYDTFDAIYNPDTWEALANDKCCDYRYLYASNFQPMIKSFRTVPWDTGTGSVIDFTLSWTFNINPSIWGAPLSSIYAIAPINQDANSGFPQYGYDFIAYDQRNIKITNQYNFGTITKTEVSTIDFYNIDYNPSVGKEVMFIGNVALNSNGVMYRPSFVYNVTTKQVVSNVHPVSIYPSFSPGQLYPTRNKITVKMGNANSITSNPAIEPNPSFSYQSYSIAYIHLFRRV